MTHPKETSSTTEVRYYPGTLGDKSLYLVSVIMALIAGFAAICELHLIISSYLEEGPFTTWWRIKVLILFFAFVFPFMFAVVGFRSARNLKLAWENLPLSAATRDILNRPDFYFPQVDITNGGEGMISAAASPVEKAVFISAMQLKSALVGPQRVMREAIFKYAGYVGRELAAAAKKYDPAFYLWTQDEARNNPARLLATSPSLRTSIETLEVMAGQSIEYTLSVLAAASDEAARVCRSARKHFLNKVEEARQRDETRARRALLDRICGPRRKRHQQKSLFRSPTKAARTKLARTASRRRSSTLASPAKYHSPAKIRNGGQLHRIKGAAKYRSPAKIKRTFHRN